MQKFTSVVNMKSQLIGRYSRLGFWLAGIAASQPGAGFGDPWKSVWISTGAFLSNPGAGAVKKMYLRNYILHRGEAVCISVIGFQWYSMERSGFDWFDHWSFDCDCMRRLWNYIYCMSAKICWRCSALDLYSLCYRFHYAMYRRLLRFG